jgi:molybdenum cofactor cytidylyltransferase
MGRPKAALPLGSSGQTVLSHVVTTLVAADLSRIVIVVGAHGAETRVALVEGHVEWVENPRWELGQLSSLIAGLDAVDDPQLEAIVVSLVDVPLVSEATVGAVVDAWRRTRAPIVRPADGDRHGHPVVFDRSVFEELRSADPTVGAKAIFAAHQSEILNVPVDDAGAFQDLDTPEDYERIRRALRPPNP